ncbi:MAG: 1,4-dihydroxy-2-naphthoate polyprenyltransferase [Halobacteriaceae archaeon]
MTATDVSRTRAWLMAARPQTMPAAAAPVVVGTALAVAEGVFAPLPAAAALLGAALIQIGTNFANDYFDAVKGADTEEREGFTRVTQSGLIAPESVWRATLATFALAILVGCYLVYVGGVPILVVGLASVASGLAYTGGPYPFGYYGLGDLFVFVFFGLVAVAGTFYVQAAALAPGALSLWVPAGTLPPVAVVAGVPVGALATAILVVNNIRDVKTDAEAGKRTLAVRIGVRWSRVEYVTLLAVAYAVPVALWAAGRDATVLLPLLSLPYAALVARTVTTERGAVLNDALEGTGRLLAVFAALFAAGFVA